jgi:hypothetical protein
MTNLVRVTGHGKRMALIGPGSEGPICLVGTSWDSAPVTGIMGSSLIQGQEENQGDRHCGGTGGWGSPASWEVTSALL